MEIVRILPFVHFYVSWYSFYDVLLVAVARKSANGVVSCCMVSSLPSSERWKLVNSSSAITTESQLTEDSSELIDSGRKRRKLSWLVNGTLGDFKDGSNWVNGICRSRKGRILTFFPVLLFFQPCYLILIVHSCIFHCPTVEEAANCRGVSGCMTDHSPLTNSNKVTYWFNVNWP